MDKYFVNHLVSVICIRYAFIVMEIIVFMFAFLYSTCSPILQLLTLEIVANVIRALKQILLLPIKSLSK